MSRHKPSRSWIRPLINILLAKMKIMYYPYLKNVFEQSRRLVSALLFIILSLLTFQTTLSANIFEEQAEVYRVQGYEEQQKGNYKKALEFYSKALSLGLENEVLYNDMAVVYETIGARERAKGLYLQAIKLNPDYLAPYTNMAYLCLDSGDKECAAQYFQQRYIRAPIDDPWREMAKAELCRIHPQYSRQFVEAEAKELEATLAQEIVTKARQEFALRVARSETHYQRALAALAAQEWDQAIAEFDNALALTPDNPKLLAGKQRVKYEQSMEQVRKTLAAAVADLDAGDLRAARKSFQELLAIIPDESIQP